MESDVKSIMARFQAADPASAGPPSVPRHLKTPLHHTLSSGSPSPSSAPPHFLLPRKPASEGTVGGTLPPKPTFPKPPSSSSSSFKGPSRGGLEPAKALAARFSAANEEPGGSKPFPRGAPEPAGPKPKLPIQKPWASATLPEARPAPVVSTGPKPSWVRAGGPGGGGGGAGGGGAASNQGSSPKPPPTQQKLSSVINNINMMQSEDARAVPESRHGNVLASRLPAGFSIGASVPPKDAKEKGEQAPPETGRQPPNATDSRNAVAALPKPLVGKPSFVRRQVDALAAPKSAGQDGAPRKNPLLKGLLLGPAPTKPSRPPRVSLDHFRGDARGSDPAMVPPPPASHPGNHSDGGPTPPSSVQPAPPSLPPRHIEPDPDESYDDVGVLNNAPPPPPSTAGRPRLSMQDGESDGEMYEELDDRWEAADLKKEKEDKKRLEAEKKEQKEREKKEQEARKKFKLVGPLEVMHQAKVLVDSRGSKTDLALKKGEWVDIMRIHDNPGGKWLGRLENGSFGYLKNDYVEVDLQSWKQQLGSKPAQEMEDPEVYDDVDVSNNHLNSGGIRGPRVVLPPPPDEDGDIYDDAIDASLDVSRTEAAKSATKTLLLRMFERKKPAASTNEVPPPSQFTADGNSGAAIDEEVYDDIDSQGLPPPLPLSSPPTQQPKTEGIDPKRQKKFEKEEKEFRKKFKYEGDITVLYQVTIIPTLTMKKLSGKDLPVKPGETLDVIVKAVDNKLICRNEEGKFGTVLTDHVVTDDGDIYDDIGDDCIYDND